MCRRYSICSVGVYVNNCVCEGERETWDTDGYTDRQRACVPMNSILTFSPFSSILRACVFGF